MRESASHEHVPPRWVIIPVLLGLIVGALCAADRASVTTPLGPDAAAGVTGVFDAGIVLGASTITLRFDAPASGAWDAMTLTEDPAFAPTFTVAAHTGQERRLRAHPDVPVMSCVNGDGSLDALIVLPNRVFAGESATVDVPAGWWTDANGAGSGSAAGVAMLNQSRIVTTPVRVGIPLQSAADIGVPGASAAKREDMITFGAYGIWLRTDDSPLTVTVPQIVTNSPIGPATRLRFLHVARHSEIRLDEWATYLPEFYDNTRVMYFAWTVYLPDAEFETSGGTNRNGINHMRIEDGVLAKVVRLAGTNDEPIIALQNVQSTGVEFLPDTAYRVMRAWWPSRTGVGFDRLWIAPLGSGRPATPSQQLEDRTMTSSFVEQIRLRACSIPPVRKATLFVKDFAISDDPSWAWGFGSPRVESLSPGLRSDGN